MADTKTEYFDDQQVGKKSRGRYIIQKRYDGKAVCKEVVSASANEIQLKNRLGAILVWKKKKYITGAHGSGSARQKAKYREQRANRHKKS
ncbi:MAG: hypothetical protein J6M01_02630 [Prevotella sp.]|nr:hypothetical protein [Prevotella sp.]